MKLTRKWWILSLLLLTLLVTTSVTLARGRTRVGVGFGFRGPGPGFVTHVRIGPPAFHYGYGHGYYGAPLVSVRQGNYGRVDFNVRPKESQVYVDGAFIGIADDFDGGFFGTTATLRAGAHQIRVVAPDGRVVQRKIYVMPGKELDLDIRF